MGWLQGNSSSNKVLGPTKRASNLVRNDAVFHAVYTIALSLICYHCKCVLDSVSLFKFSLVTLGLAKH